MTAILSLFLYSNIYSQDLPIRDNPYDNASDVIKKRKAFNRERWFNEQRMYPNNFIPVDAYKKAYEQKIALTETEGYSMKSLLDNWVSLGPTTGFYSAYSNITSRMTTVKYDPNNGNIIYIGAAYGGVWKSANGGSTWSPLTDNEVSLSSGSIAIDPSNSNIIYYGTGEATYSGASYYGRGLLKSIDGGATWTNYSSNLPSLSYTSRIVVRPKILHTCLLRWERMVYTAALTAV